MWQLQAIFHQKISGDLKTIFLPACHSSAPKFLFQEELSIDIQLLQAL